MTMSAYDAVFWDIGGVIVELESIREGYETFVAALTDEFDVDADDPLETWKSTLGAHFKSREGTEFRSAREGYLEATAALFEDPPEASEWWPMFEDAIAASLRPEEGAVETVRALDERGVYQGIVSDIDDREAETMLGAFGIRDCFDAVTTSEAVGHTKPDRRMFETALGTWGGDPSRAVMVGDRYRHDVAGAKATDLDTVAYGEDAFGEDADHEIRDLRELLDIV